MAALSTVSILFCDLVGSTDLMTRVGDAASDDIRRACFAAWRGALSDHRGTEVKAQGDGLMACFTSAVEAVECGAALQAATARLDRERPDLGLSLRVGISAGDASFDDGDWYGTPVVEAARLCAAAEPGQILAAGIVVTLSRSRSERAFADAGTYTLKGLAAPLAASSVSWDRPQVAPRVPLPRALARRDSVFAFFVGRQDELDRMVRSWKQVAAGERRCFFVAGEPGIGKSTLVAEAARLAYDEGATVVHGRCDQELSAPFQPFAEGLRGLLGTADQSLLEELRPHLAEVSRLVPAARELAPGLPAPADAEPDVERQLLFDAVAGLLAGLGPVVLVLDDLHWATRPTLLLLRHLLLRATSDHPLLVLATYRDTDLSRSHPLAGMLADLRRADAARRIGLRGFTLEEGTAFVEAATGHHLEEMQQRLAETMHEVTSGNPLFLREMLSHLVETGVVYQRDGRWLTDIDEVDLERLGLPEGVRDAISRRLSALSDRANEVLPVAAVIGPTFELRVLDRIPELEAGAVDALDEVLATGLIAEGAGPGNYQFVHALVRQTLLDELTSTRRMRLHRRVAEAIEAQPDAGERSGALAHHYAEAALDGCAEKAADYALIAAQRAHDRAAPEEALRHATRGLEVLDLAGVIDRGRRADLHLAVGRASDGAAAARAALVRAAELARTEGDSRRLAEAAIRLSRLTLLGQEDPPTEALLAEAIETAQDGFVRCGAMACLAVYRYRAGSGKGADLAEEALAEARQLGDHSALVAALWARLIVLTGSPDLPQRRRLTDEVVAAVARAADAERSTGAQWGPGVYSHDVDLYRGIVLLQAGDRDGYDGYAEAFLATADARNPRNGDGIRTLAALMEGRLSEAEAMIQAGQARQNERVGELNTSLVQFMLLRREQGRWEEIHDALAASAAANPSLVAFEAGLLLAEAELGRVDDAAQRLRSLVADGLPRVPRDSLFPTVLSFVSLAAAIVDDAEASADLLPHVAPYRGQVLTVSGWLAALGSADRFEALLLTTLGRYDEADVRFESARSLERRIRAEPFIARTDVAHAELLQRRGKPGDDARARSLLLGAEGVAARLGMDGLLGQVAALRAGV